MPDSISADLFEADPPDACPAYRHLRRADNRRTAAGRAHCETLWQSFRPFADPHFVSEFALHLHQRWFEMYLAVSLLRAGLPVSAPKPGPDVRIDCPARRIWIEAVCATAGEAGHPDAVPMIDYSANAPVVTNVPLETMTLRVRAALAEKVRKYEVYHQQRIVEGDDLLVVAINVQAVPHAAFHLPELMMRALYGQGDEVLTVDRRSGAVVDSGFEQVAMIRKRATGAAVGVRPLIDGSIPSIGAVLGSSADAVNRPERLGDDFRLCPNLTSRARWHPGTIALGCEWVFADHGDRGWRGQLQRYG